ncbi:hypothetical protein HYH03_003409 [Edaphochlamys debaryana]|uniref:Uncharacterized protein n=1 Tax=Edaphochlamys debaryana TaxID=47281 RepID=A0A835Y9R4_9CHLO|nr:hypothetical protein HYH03_003409 [Edaphochlamys debaryana]|eukprot:KAG2498663.1 hypothetical protein HYH03_003409 [Edaphochlamys debaryana]
MRNPSRAMLVAMPQRYPDVCCGYYKGTDLTPTLVWTPLDVWVWVITDAGQWRRSAVRDGDVRPRAERERPGGVCADLAWPL